MLSSSISRSGGKSVKETKAYLSKFGEGNIEECPVFQVVTASWEAAAGATLVMTVLEAG